MEFEAAICSQNLLVQTCWIHPLLPDFHRGGCRLTPSDFAFAVGIPFQISKVNFGLMWIFENVYQVPLSIHVLHLVSSKNFLRSWNVTVICELPCSPVNIRVSIFSISYWIAVNTLKRRLYIRYLGRLLPDSYPLKSPFIFAEIVIRYKFGKVT